MTNSKARDRLFRPFRQWLSLFNSFLSQVLVRRHTDRQFEQAADEVKLAKTCDLGQVGPFEGLIEVRVDVVSNLHNLEAQSHFLVSKGH